MAKGRLTQQRLKELLSYDPVTGIFIRKISRQGHAKTGQKAGTPTPMGYIAIGVDGKRYMAHRLAWLYMEGYIPDSSVGLDHIDRVKNNNKFNNLRMVSQSCNLKNASLSSKNTSGIKGVSWSKSKGKWESYIKVNYKRKYLGRYDELIDAAKARWEAEKKYNFITCDTDSTAYNFIKAEDKIWI